MHRWTGRTSSFWASTTRLMVSYMTRFPKPTNHRNRRSGEVRRTVGQVSCRYGTSPPSATEVSFAATSCRWPLTTDGQRVPAWERQLDRMFQLPPGQDQRETDDQTLSRSSSRCFNGSWFIGELHPSSEVMKQGWSGGLKWCGIRPWVELLPHYRR